MDFEFLKGATFSVPGTKSYQVAAAATPLAVGTPLKLASAGSPDVIALADAEPVIGTTTAYVGLAAAESTNTSTAAGEVEVFLPLPGVTYLAPAKTASNIDTQAKYDLLVNNQVLFDLTSGVFTVDESATHNANNGLVIVDLDTAIHPGKVAFTVKQSATIN
jgi:hypothetical protein